MDPFFVKAIQLILSLSLLIVLHELGHFIPARIFKTRVEKFFLFFDVRFALLKKKIGETVYGIGWLPLGGYVKIAGMIDESMDKEQMAQPPKPWEFRSKPAWQRLIIMLGGVTVNIILGILIYIGIVFANGTSYVSVEGMPDGFEVHERFRELGFRNGDRILEVNGEPIEDQREINRLLFLRDVRVVRALHQDGSRSEIDIPEGIGMTMFKEGVLQPFSERATTEVDSIQPGSPAERAGLKKGDKILSIDDKTLIRYNDLQEALPEDPNSLIDLMVRRDGLPISLSLMTDEEGKMGIWPNPGYETGRRTYSFFESIPRGAAYGVDILTDYVTQFKYVFTRQGATQLGGFGTIGSLFPDSWNWLQFWHTTALISIILAFMNVLPIPALDGGHVMFLLYEMATGRKPGDKVLEYAQVIGFILIIGLVLYANGNDIYRWLFK